MEPTLLVVQFLNGIQLGTLLFLVASGLTLVFGILDVINLAHGVVYMVGAYAAASTFVRSGSLALAIAIAPIAALLVGLLLDRLVLRFLYDRDHLDQVLATFGVILFVDEAVRAIFGPAALPYPLPPAFEWSLELPGGATYPAWRLVIIVSGLVLAAILFGILHRTRAGMVVRAAATDPGMLAMLGVDIRRLFLVVLGAGSALAGFAGALAGPIVAVQPGMGDSVLILSFVVIVTGGLGSVQGALLGSFLVGLADTLGRSFLTDLLRLLLPPAAANEVGPALASMAIYLVMAIVLLIRPQGLVSLRRAAR
ncbi:MAG: branched-chain amino acid ABC transporter permease [Geminicoccaceae bacterium]|nr:branched-chain amino acid ABC transporter permease [Geminicoccaceae bacterium]MCX7630412.1 branched-chain amino acid ABC transporter permease [Geminicoccaceae bacterium]MDW8340163.1 branched-chain amino acid ABC transporter permease [Geminicoccaceae bacterium]